VPFFSELALVLADEAFENALDAANQENPHPNRIKKAHLSKKESLWVWDFMWALPSGSRIDLYGGKLQNGRV
jgi:hypothetical protein